jgi:hypothetical protein
MRKSIVLKRTLSGEAFSKSDNGRAEDLTQGEFLIVRINLDEIK